MKTVKKKGPTREQQFTSEAKRKISRTSYISKLIVPCRRANFNHGGRGR